MLRVFGHHLPQYREVVIDPEQFAHVIRLADQFLHSLRPERPQHLQLITQVFGLLPPLVEPRHCRVGGRILEGPTSPAVLVLQPFADHRPPVGHLGPVLDTLLRLMDDVPDAGECVLLDQHSIAHGTEVGLERLADRVEGRTHDVLLEVLDQFVQRIDQDLGVADFGQRAAGVAEAEVLGVEALLADHRTDKT